jgi:ABC-type nitrate/sulfonate/bicarbonate transport system ATPase subunit
MKTQLKIAVSGPSETKQKKLLKIHGLRKVFDTGGVYLHVLEQIDFSVEKGELICILGRSGCGKSTLLKILAGFIPPTDGKILLHDDPVSRPGPDRCVVFQEDALFPWLTVQENIAFGMQGRGWSSSQKKENVDRFLSLVGLSEFRNYLPREISGGMKQRVALARVLVLQPRVLLMDEPFAALDAQTREEMQNLLLSLWQKLSHTILFVTHDVQEAVALADRILLMDKDPGRIREDIRIDLPRPREMNTHRFLESCRYLFDAVR